MGPRSQNSVLLPIFCSSHTQHARSSSFIRRKSQECENNMARVGNGSLCLSYHLDLVQNISQHGSCWMIKVLTTIMIPITRCDTLFDWNHIDHVLQLHTPFDKWEGNVLLYTIVSQWNCIRWYDNHWIVQYYSSMICTLSIVDTSYKFRNVLLYTIVSQWNCIRWYDNHWIVQYYSSMICTLSIVDTSYNKHNIKHCYKHTVKHCFKLSQAHYQALFQTVTSTLSSTVTNTATNTLSSVQITWLLYYTE